MSFIDMDLDAVEESKPVAEGTYTLVIEDVKEKEKEGVQTGLLVILSIEGQPTAANVLHNLSFPLDADDDQKKKNKLLFMKRFLVLFGIPFQGGIDLTKFAGKRAACALGLKEYQGSVSNELKLPMIK